MWQTKEPIRAQPWSPYIPGNDKKPDAPAEEQLTPLSTTA
ncbi:hypothetical protein IBA8403_16540 [Pseudomonas syringae]